MKFLKTSQQIMKNIIKKLTLIIPLFVTIFAIAIITSCEFEKNESNPISIEIEHMRGSELNFTITNNGSEDLLFSSYDIPMKGHYKQYFKITDENGSEVPYVGMYAIIVQTRDMWHLIESEESIDFNVDIHGVYDFASTSGKYNIEFISSVTVKNLNDFDERINGEDEEYISSDNDQIYTVKSNKIESEIDITNSDITEYDLSRASYSCNSNQKKYISTTNSKAKSMLQKTNKNIKAKKTDSVWQALFGKKNNSRYTFVKKGIEKIKGSFKKSWKYNCPSNSNGAIAYVYKGKPYEVWLCPPFFKDTSTDSNKLKFNASVLAHEASHWNAIIGTEDYAYYGDCAALAKKKPDQAIKNADSYRQYIMNTNK